MKRFLSIAIILTLVSTAMAKYDGLPPQVESAAAAIAKYPKASSILLWSQEKYTMLLSGAEVYELHTFRYLPDDASRDTWGDPILRYEDGEQKLEILAARAYTNDGRKVDATPQNAYNQSTPEELQLAPQFSKFRDMVVTLLGLENGCVAELNYKITTDKPLFPWMYGRVYFRDAAPCISRELIVEMPIGQKLKYKCGGGLAEPKVSESTYTWNVGETKGYDPEDFAESSELLSNVSFTTAGDWMEIQGEIKARVDRMSVADLPIPESLSKAFSGINEPENKFEAIRGWVRERFNALEYPHPDFAISIRPLKEVMHSGYGNHFELAALVAKLSNQSGVSASVMLQYKGEAPMPSLAEVTDAVVAYHSGDEYFLCDPIAPRDEVAQADLVGNTLLPANIEEKTTVMPLFPTGANNLNVSISLDKLDADTISGTGTFSSRGQLAPYEAVRTKGAEAYLDETLKIKGLKITKATVKELMLATTVIDFSFTAVAPLDTAGNFRTLPLSLYDVSMIAHGAPLGLLSREFPQRIHIPGEVSLNIDAEIPDGWSVVARHPDLTSDQTWGQTTVTTKIDKSHFSFMRKILLADRAIPATGWTELRQWLLGCGARNDNCVVFSVKK